MANFLIDHVYTLDITPSARPQLVHVSEYDVGRIFTFTLKHNGEEMTIPSSYGVVTVEGTIGSYAFSEPASIENGKIVFQLTESMTAHAGKAWTKIKFANADAPVSTCAFILAVDRAGVEAETVIGAPGFEEQIQDAVDAWLDEHGGDGSGSGLSDDAKTAILNCFSNVAWANQNGQTYYNALQSALYPPSNLISISAVFVQGQHIVTESDTLDSLRQYLTVTARYSDSSTQTVSDYTLSGTLREGTSTITVAYGGKTTTFTCTVQSSPTSDMDGWADGVAYTNLTIVPNSYSRKRDGEFISYEGWDRTDFVPCNGAATIVFPPMPILANENPESNNFYDENHARISSFNLSKTLTVTITVPQTAYYFVISGETGVLQGCISNGIVPHGE